MKTKTPARTMNTTEAAMALGVATSTFRRICTRHNIKPVAFLAGRVLYRQSDVNRLARKPDAGRCPQGLRRACA